VDFVVSMRRGGIQAENSGVVELGYAMLTFPGLPPRILQTVGESCSTAGIGGRELNCAVR
jgi:hypothetical protein